MLQSGSNSSRDTASFCKPRRPGRRSLVGINTGVEAGVGARQGFRLVMVAGTAFDAIRRVGGSTRDGHDPAALVASLELAKADSQAPRVLGSESVHETPGSVRLLPIWS